VRTVEEIDLVAPAEQPMEVTRKSLLMAPDWRYQAARIYLDDEHREVTPMVSDDPLVQFTVRALRGYRTANARRYVINLCPAVEEVFYYGIDHRGSAMSAEMDSCLIKGWDYDIAAEAGCPVKREVYDLYAGIFFDLTGIKAVHAWINDFLFEPERYKSDQRLLRSRLLSYFGAGGSGMTSRVTGMLLPAEEASMKNIMRSERQKQLFDYMVKHTKLDPITYSGFMETAVKNMTEHDFQEHMKDRAEAGSGSLEDLADKLEKGIRAYSQQEQDEHSPIGLDFVNQYTRTVIGDDYEQ